MALQAIRLRGASMGCSPIRRALLFAIIFGRIMNAIGVMILIQPAVLCLVLSCALIVTGLIWIFWIRLIPGAARKALIGVLTCLVLCLAMSVGIWLKYEIAPVSCETIVALDPGLK